MVSDHGHTAGRSGSCAKRRAGRLAYGCLFAAPAGSSSDANTDVASVVFTFTVNPVLAVASAQALPAGMVGVFYNQMLSATGGDGGYQWTLAAGSLPPGFNLGASGYVQGTPTIAGAYAFQLRVTDDLGYAATANFTLTIGVCSYTLYPSGQAFAGAGGTGIITVTSQVGCGWTTVPPPGWITITGGTTGTGSGAVAYRTAANTGAWRSASFTVAGSSFVVEQSSATLGALNTVGAMPHLATGGGGWQTTFVLTNTGASAAQARLNFYDDNGAALLLPLNFPQAPLAGPLLASQLEETINPGSELVIQTASASATQVTGWAQLLSNGGITGYARFDWSIGGGLQEAVVPLEARDPPAFFTWFDHSSSGFATGLAVANVSAWSATVPVSVRDDAGNLLTRDTISLPAFGHLAFVATDRYPATAGKRGTVEFDTPASGQIATLAFRASAAGTLSTVPSTVTDGPASIQFQDTFNTPGTKLNLAAWTTEIGNGSYLGRTQLADSGDARRRGPVRGGFGRRAVGAQHVQPDRRFHVRHAGQDHRHVPAASEFGGRVQDADATDLASAGAGLCRVPVQLSEHRLRHARRNRYRSRDHSASRAGLCKWS